MKAFGPFRGVAYLLVAMLSIGALGAASRHYWESFLHDRGAVIEPFELHLESVVISDVTDAARDAGLTPGARVLALNGETVRGEGVLNRVLSNSLPGDSLLVEVEHLTETFRVSVPLERIEWEFDEAFLVLFIELILPVACTVVGLGSIWKRPQSILAWLVFGVLAGMGNQVHSSDFRLADSFSDLLIGGYILTIRHFWFASLLLFVIYFPSRLSIDLKRPYLKWIVLMPVVLQAAFITSVQLLRLVDFALVETSVGIYNAIPSLFKGVLNQSFNVGLLLSLLIICVRYRAEKSHDERRRMRLLWAGTMASLGPAIVVIMVSDFLVGSGLNQVPHWLTMAVIFPLIFFPGVVRYVVLVDAASEVVTRLREVLVRCIEPHRLYGIRMLAGAAAATCFLIWFLTDGPAPKVLLFVACPSAALALMCRPAVVERMKSWLDASLFSEHSRMEASLADLEQRVAAGRDLDALPGKVCRELSEIMAASPVCLVVSDSDDASFRVGQSTDPSVLGEQVTAAGPLLDLIRRNGGALCVTPRGLDEAGDGSDRELRADLDRLRSRLLVALPDRPYVRGFVSSGPRPLDVPYSTAELQLIGAVTSALSLALQSAALVERVSEGIAVRERLATEKAAAEQASKAKSDFLSSMSHELRTPLNAILGYAELLQEDADEEGDSQRSSDLEKIQIAGKHLLEVINTVLDLSKAEAGRMQPHFESFRLSVLLNEINAIVAPLAAEKGNRFVVSSPERELVLESDRLKLRQCLINLLGNACKFTSDGTVKLEVAPREVDGSTWIRMNVRDTGIGMSEGQIKRLFKAFSQVHSSAPAKYGGTGLGLALSKEFAKLLGGDISVESEPGAGTTFRLEVPVKCGGRTGPSLEWATPAGNTRAVVLIIDDDPAVHEVMGRSLAQVGFRTIHTMNGNEGLRVAREAKPDIILLDILMADTDGWRVLMELKESADTMRTPVLVSSVLDRSEGDPCLIADDYLMKPVSRKRLQSVVRQHCTRQRGKRGATVLIVDDDPGVRAVICALLEAEGCHVIDCASAPVAFSAASERQVDLIMTDLSMPGMDGFELIGALRGRQATARIPIVVLTGKELSAEERRRLRASTAVILEKVPDWQDRLTEQVRNVIGAERSGRRDG